MKQEDWRKAEELFHAALALVPQARSVFLNDSCGGDSALLQRVEWLLAQDAQAGSFLERPALGDMTPAVMTVESLLGRDFGSFHITARLGAGGMGEVYRAEDRRLGRDVAIKILPFAFARDPARLARFRREARTLASLNHPSIAAIYGLEQLDGVDCLVLELVEGETLAERIQQRGPVPLATALEWARQIAEALEAAHAKGIIHRDLKPANVKVTPEGRIKVLDFGLAKAVAAPDGEWPGSELPTMTGLVTVAGHIVGTPGYTSPEQARGEDVDQRTDIWAFGCLLYELLAGQRAFKADSVPETIAAVLEREPDWQRLSEKTPAKIRDLLRHCLEKHPTRRPPTIVDVRRRIEKAQRGWNWWQVAAVGATGLAGLVIAVVLSRRAQVPVSDPSKWAQLTKFPDSVTQPALSPDGGMLAFIRGPSLWIGPGQIYVKILPTGEPVQLTHDNVEKMRPVFSPDGTRIGYTAYMDKEFSWDTWVVPTLGGEPQRWLKNASGLAWTGPREVMFSEVKMGLHMGVVAADENRMGERDVYLPKPEPNMAHLSYLSPDRKWVLLAEMDEDHLWESCRVVPADGTSQGRKVGPPGGGCTAGAWTPDGKWIYLTSNAVGTNHIWRQRFPDGEPEEITSGPTEEEGIAMAADGRSFITAVALQNSSLWVHGANGERQISIEGNATNPKFTPDGRKLLFRMVNAPPSEFAWYRDLGEVWIADVESGRSEPLVRGLRALDYDVSADGRQVVMATTDQEGKPRLWLASVDRSSPAHQIPNVEGGAPRFLPDGDILFRRVAGTNAMGSIGFVYRVRPDGSRLQKALERSVLIMGNVSPDGQWLIAWALLPGNGPPATQAFPLDGAPPIALGSGTIVDWSSDRSSAAFASAFGSPIPEGRSYIVPLSPGQALPPISKAGVHTEDEIAHLPGARRIDIGHLVPGPSADTYAFFRGTVQRNLYRIPIQ